MNESSQQTGSTTDVDFDAEVRRVMGRVPMCPSCRKPNVKINSDWTLRRHQAIDGSGVCPGATVGYELNEVLMQHSMYIPPHLWEMGRRATHVADPTREQIENSINRWSHSVNGLRPLTH